MYVCSTLGNYIGVYSTTYNCGEKLNQQALEADD